MSISVGGSSLADSLSSIVVALKRGRMSKTLHVRVESFIFQYVLEAWKEFVFFLSKHDF